MINLGGDYDLSKNRLVKRTAETLFWSVVDLDGTFAAGDPAARLKARRMLESVGALLFCTARTPELVMDARAFELSRSLAGFTRSAPTSLVSDGVYYDDPLTALPADQKNPDAILAFGQGIYVGGLAAEASGCGPYFVDTEYKDRYLDPIASDGTLLAGTSWYELALGLIRELGLEKNLVVYKNVDRPDFRLELKFSGPDAVVQKYKALELINANKKGPLVGRLEGVDESKPSETPDESQATLYAMPPVARKEDMVNYVLNRICRSLKVDTSQMSGLIIGDTLTDFYSACYAGWDADFTGMIVGGSRISKCIEEKANFAGVDLRHMHSALIPTDRAGFYKFINPLRRGGWIKKGSTRTVILGEQAYPGTVGAETILAYLEERAAKQASAQ